MSALHISAGLPGLARAARALPVADRALAEEWEPEVWAAAAAAASVARFCSCRWLTPGDGDTLELRTQSIECMDQPDPALDGIWTSQTLPWMEYGPA